MIMAWMSQAWATVQVDYTVTEHSIEGQPVYVDILVLNTGRTSVEIPDIVNNRWHIEFTLSSNGQTQKISSQKSSDEIVQTRTLKPREVLELHLEIPNSKALKTGTHKLEIDFPLDKPQHHNSNIHVHKQSVHWADLNALENETFLNTDDVLWTTPFKDNYLLFEGISTPRWINSIPVSNAYSTVHIGEQSHTYWIKDNTITLLEHEGERLRPIQEIQIPWKDFELIGRGVTNIQGSIFLPVWVPNPNGTGTLYSVQPQLDHTVVFRKIKTGSKPNSIEVAINQASIPLFLLKYSQTLELFALTTVGEARIDKLAPKSVKIYPSTPEASWLDAAFVVTEDAGLHIASVSNTLDSLTCTEHSLSGSQLTQHTTIVPGKPDTITIQNIAIESDKPWIFIQHDKQSYIWSSSGLTTQNIPIGAVITTEPSLDYWMIENHQLVKRPITEKK